ncbi:MAG: histidine phosphatase family protein [Nocardioidaceae bacterium]
MGSLLLVRHGQASFGAADYDVLSDVGREQSRLVGRYLAERGVAADRVLHGTQRRQRHTAQELVAAAGWGVSTEVDEDWDEFDHVKTIGALAPEIVDTTDRRAYQRAYEEALSRWVSGHEPDGIEPFLSFVARVRGALERACEHAGPGGTALAVSSGGPITAAVATLIDPDGSLADLARIWQRMNVVLVNTSLTRVVVGSTGARLLTFNEHPHISPGSPLLTYR